MNADQGESRPLLVQQLNNAPSPTAPFFAFPSWWRRFIFQLMAPRELITYLYICSLISRAGIAYPTQAQIAQETGVSSLDIVAKSVKNILSYGLLIRNMQRFGGFTRPVYQRPAPEFSLIRLLDIKAIDNELYPFDRIHDFRTSDLDTAEQAVKLGLRNLLGDESFAAYASGRNQLRSLLDLRFAQRTGMLFDKAWAALERYDIYDFSFTSSVTVRFAENRIDAGLKRLKAMLEHGIDTLPEAARIQVGQPIPTSQGRMILPINFGTQRPLSHLEAMNLAVLTVKHLKTHIDQAKYVVEVMEDAMPAIASTSRI